MSTHDAISRLQRDAEAGVIAAWRYLAYLDLEKRFLLHTLKPDWHEKGYMVPCDLQVDGLNPIGGDGLPIERAPKVLEFLGIDPFKHDVWVDMIGVDISTIPIIGTAGDDVLTGSAEDDNIFGLGGNDTIDGGGGIDTAHFGGDMAGYTISVINDQITVADNDPATAGDDGTDSIANTEALRFTDGDITVGATPPIQNPITPQNPEQNVVEPGGSFGVDNSTITPPASWVLAPATETISCNDSTAGAVEGSTASSHSGGTGFGP